MVQTHNFTVKKKCGINTDTVTVPAQRVACVQDVHTEMAEAGLEEIILYQARTRVFLKTAYQWDLSRAWGFGQCSRTRHL
jgi:hypothetical protein